MWVCVCGWVDGWDMCVSNARVHISTCVCMCVCECVITLTGQCVNMYFCLGSYTGTKMVAVLVFSDSSSNANR